MVANWLVHALAALIPMLVGMIWYNPKVFGKAWMKAAQVTEDTIKNANMGLIYGLSLVFSFILTMFYHFAVSHTGAFTTLFRGTEEHGVGFDINSAGAQELIPLLGAYHERFESFTHGMAHGFGASLLLLLPVFVSNSLFEHKGWKYILINWGYWTITIMLMMGVIGEFSNNDFNDYLAPFLNPS